MIFADMLNKKAQKNGSRIIEQLNIHEGNVIADIGSGGGYFVYQFALKVGANGTVYAVDTNQKLLNHVNSNAKKMNLNNVRIVLAKETNCLLPKNYVDLVFMSNVFHHMENPIEYFTNIRSCLKENGKVAVIDYDERNKINYIALTGHTTTESVILNTLEAAGFKRLKNIKILKKQSFNIFGIKV